MCTGKEQDGFGRTAGRLDLLDDELAVPHPLRKG